MAEAYRDRGGQHTNMWSLTEALHTYRPWVSAVGRVEHLTWQHRATAEDSKAAGLKSARPLPVAVSLRSCLNYLGAGSRRARVIDRDFEALASRDSLGTLGRHHGVHLAAKLGGNLAVGECLLDCGSKLTLPSRRCRRSIATHALNVVRLDSLDGFARPPRRRVLAGLQPRTLLRSRFPVANCRRVANRLQPL